MSNISTVYDEIITKTSALLSGKTRIYNPYELTDNAELSLKDSWGVKTLTADKTNQDYCNVTIERNFALVLTRVLFTTNKPEDFDTVTKAMLEDQQSFVEMVYASGAFTVGNTYEDSIVSISGIEFIQTDEKKFIFCEVQFKITINELQS